MTGCIVTVTATVMSGTVVRWFPTLERAEANTPVISASRNEVVVHDRDHVIGEWRYAADQAWRRLARDRDADMSDLATHKRRGPFGPLEAVHRHELAKCPACRGSGIYDEYGYDDVCELCSGRGYMRPEECGVCGEPMGNARRRWKRERREAAPTDEGSQP